MFIYMALLLISITSSYKKTSHWLWIISTNNTPSTNYGSKDQLWNLKTLEQLP